MNQLSDYMCRKTVMFRKHRSGHAGLLQVCKSFLATSTIHVSRNQLIRVTRGYPLILTKSTRQASRDSSKENPLCKGQLIIHFIA
jgi:hypothetical protein